MGGLLLLTPIVTGVVLTYAFIGATGVPVGLGTSSFAAIAIGVVVESYLDLAMKYRRMTRSISKEIPLDIIPLKAEGAPAAFLEEITAGE